MFGSDPPSVNTKLLNANRENMERMAQFGEGVVQDYDAYRQDMQNYTTDLMQNVVGQQMQVFQEQLGNSQELFGMAQEDRQYYEDFYKPIEAQLRQDAMEWDRPDVLRQEMGEAAATAGQAFDAAKRNQRQQLESYGVDPSMTRESALDRGVDIARAAAQAGAANTARSTREMEAQQLRSNVAGAGERATQRGLQESQQGQQGLAQNVNMGAVTTGTAGRTVGRNLQQTAGGQQLAAGVGGQYGDINTDYLNQYNAQLAEHNATMQPGEVIAGVGSSVLGGLAGGGAFNPLIEAGGKKLFGLSEGGAVPTPEEAGVAPAAPSQVMGDPANTDRTPAALTPGEFIIPEDVARWKGEEYFQKEIQKARDGKVQGAIPAGAAA